MRGVKLHQTISLDRPLLVVALEEEAQHLHVSDLPVLVTGVGKVCAAAALASVLARQRPSRVINLGTAGGLREGIRGTQVVGRVEQYDLVDMEGYAIAFTAQQFGLPVTLVKEISDPADEGAAKTWRESIDDCAERLGEWLHRELRGS